MDLNFLSAFAALVLFYFISSTIYYLYLSPISKIPGPKLAAATWWYEYYHDIVTYGKYIFKVMDMHKQYGPIVRISPHEVHISDPDFYETLYASSSTNRKDRWSWYTDGLGLPVSTLGTVEYNLHRRRRGAMSSFFSKQKVAKLQPAVEERAAKLAERLAGLAVTGEVAPMNLAFSAYTNGMAFAFGSEVKEANRT
jgi:cytochrome P450